MGSVETTQQTPTRILDEEGRVLDDAVVPDLSDDALVDLYRDLYFARRFDRRAVNLNRQGRMGSFPPMYGQEAAQVASAWALEDTDWIVPSYRDHGALMTHGLDPERILLYYMGVEAGNEIPADVNVFPINGSVGSQLPHAMGLAWGDVLRGESDAAYVCYFGDGATSQGDVQEAFNFAGVFDTPNVFFCQNNQWAISVPRERQTAAETLAQKADAYGFDGVQVDGMDPLAVYAVTRWAVERAKDPPEGERRPSLIEAVLYRLGAHSTADDPTKYREEVPDRWKRLDPVPRYEAFLRRRGLVDHEHLDALQAEVDERLADVIERAESRREPDPRGMFEHTFADMPERLEEQAAVLDDLRARHGDEDLLGGE